MSHVNTINARIKNTTLGYEDHGIFTFALTLDYGGSGQTYGHFALDEYDEEQERRIGVAFGTEAIAQVLKTVGVDSWENLPGKHIRVRQSHSQVEAIGNILKDDWLDLRVLAESMRE